ncbi:MAG: S-layer homology domain-containing protein, partial [Oscillibacter sp.]|nr:S-layer homology domain-containing protein [Oscillibacter sp.]
STPGAPSVPGTPVAPQPPVVPEEPKGTVSASHKNADHKDEVIITVTPEEGHVVNRVTVTDHKGEFVPIKALDNYTYVFEMPDGDVVVDSTFAKQPESVHVTGVATLLKTEEKIAYMQGKGDDKFHPTDPVTRAEVAMMFYRLLKDTDVEYVRGFEDVKGDAWYADAVNTLTAYGIIKGVSETRFDPSTPITRAQFVAICARFAQISAEGQTFLDVPESHWAREYISTASGFGWVNGVTDELFAPDRSITRAEAAAIVNRVLERIADRSYIDSMDEQVYSDVHSLNWAWYDINEASLGDLKR